jgi:T-complex protein 1 subunit gamma
MLAVAEPYLHQNMHPTILVSAYSKAKEDALAECERLATTVDINNREQVMSIIRSCIATKFSARFGDQMVDLALKAVQAVVIDTENQQKEIDIKRYVRVEKVCFPVLPCWFTHTDW